MTTAANSTAVTTVLQAKLWYGVYTLEGISILLVSAVTIAVFWRRRLALKRASYLLLNLAFADLSVGVGVTTFGAYSLLCGETVSSFDAALSCFLCSSVAASIYSLVVIAVERAFAFAKPLKHRALPTAYYYRTIAFVWVLTAAAAISWWLRISGFYHARFFTCVTFMACLIVIFLSYLVVWWFSSLKRLPGTVDVRVHEKNRKLAVTLSIVTLLSLATWLPSQVQVVRQSGNAADPSVIRTEQLFPALLLMYVNSLVNPMVYVLRMPAFRQELKRLFRCGKCCLPTGMQVWQFVGQPIRVCSANAFRQELKRLFGCAKLCHERR